MIAFQNKCFGLVLRNVACYITLDIAFFKHISYVLLYNVKGQDQQTILCNRVK